MAFRIIPRLDVKPPYLVKGVHLEGVRKLGNPESFAECYYNDGADEIIYQDVIASLYGRNSIADIVQRTAERLFVPVTVGGGLRTMDDIQTMLRHGADKVCLNTMAIKNPSMISHAARIFGSQCIVVALEIMKYKTEYWEPLMESGRQHTRLNAMEWAKRVADLGAGELLITVIANEGTKKGFDFEFVDMIMDKVSVPVVLHGGAGNSEHILQAAKAGISGVAISSILHYKLESIRGIKSHLIRHGVNVRP